MNLHWRIQEGVGGTEGPMLAPSLFFFFIFFFIIAKFTSKKLVLNE